VRRRHAAVRARQHRNGGPRLSADLRTTLDAVLARSIAAHRLGGGPTSVAAVAATAGGLYGSNPAAHFSLAARLEGYLPSDLVAAEADRSVVRVGAMRTSIYLLPPELAPFGIVLGQLPNRDWLTTASGLGAAGFAGLADRVEAHLAGGPPRTSGQIRTALALATAEATALVYVLRRLGADGRIVRSGVRGGVRSQTWLYARAADWLPILGEPLPSLADALRALVPRWLAANAPVTMADLAWWASIPSPEAAALLAELAPVAVKIDGLAGDHWAPREVAEALADGRAAPTGTLHLLAAWDAWTMASRHRARSLASRDVPFVVDRSGNTTNMILLDGRVAGTWDVAGTTLLYAPFRALDKAALLSAATRLAGLLQVFDVREVTPRPLDDIGRQAFMAPLRSKQSA
jgi:hypothetical protein